MNPANPGGIAAKLRSGSFETPQQVADAVAVAIDGFYKHQTNRKGLHDDSVVTLHGGTKLSPTDNSAGRTSVSLQPPQLMLLRKHGAIASRQQLRADVEVKTLPATVIDVAGEGVDAVITVVPSGEAPNLAVDPITNQNYVADPHFYLGSASDMSASGISQRSVQLKGIAFTGTGEAGPSLPTVGQTLMIALNRQSEKRTIWTERNGVNAPRVFSIDQGESAAIVNGLCCHDAGGGGGGPGGS